MIKLALTSVASLTFIASCADSSMVEQDSKKSAAESTSSPSSPKDSHSSSPSSLGGSEQAKSQASVPVMVGGSFLTCSSQSWESAGQNIVCSLGSSIQVRDLTVEDIEKVSLIDTTKEEAKDIDFMEVDRRSFQVQVPGNNTIWGIQVKFNNGVVVVDYESGSSYLDGNAVQDSGFETFARTNNTAFLGSNFRYIAPNSANAWVHGNTDSSSCSGNRSFFELGFATLRDEVVEGDFFADLDAGCPNLAARGANIFIEQDLELKPGYLYLLSFRYNSRIDPFGYQADKTASLRITLGDVELGSIENIRNGDWSRFKTLVTAQGDSSKLRFTETGVSDNLGTLVDDIRLIPIGPMASQLVAY